MQNIHPIDPQSNISKFGSYDSDKYAINNVSLTVATDESLTPGRPPCLTQRTIGKYLVPLTRELNELPPRPTCNELSDAVRENTVMKDKAFWVDKPGANAYTLHDAYRNCGMKSEKVLPHHQDVFPRSYQYDLDCIKYRRTHACDGLKDPKKALCAHCRNDCHNTKKSGLTAFQLAWAQDPGQKRWRYYPDLTATLSPVEIRKSMAEVGRLYRHEACTWYNENYPSVKYDCIVRKFAK